MQIEQDAREDKFATHHDYFVDRCSKSSCTTCTLRFLHSVRLVALATIYRSALKIDSKSKPMGNIILLSILYAGFIAQYAVNIVLTRNLDLDGLGDFNVAVSVATIC